MESPGRTDEGSSVRAIYAALTVVFAALPWIPRWVPTQDGPQQLRLSAFLIEMRTDPLSPLHAVFHDSLGLVTGSSFTWFCYLLHPLFSVETAERLWLSLSIAAFAWVGWLITRTARPEAPARALLLAPFLVNGFTTSGFFPYLASVPLAAGGVWLLVSPSSGRVLLRGVLASVLITLSCLGHVSSFALAFAFVPLMLLLQRVGWRVVATRMLAFVPALLVALRSTRVLDVAVSAHQTPISDVIETRSPFETLVHFFLYVTAGVGLVDRVVQVILLAVVAVLVGAAVVLLFQRGEPGPERVVALRLPTSAWPLALLFVLGFVLLVLPTRFGGWSHASARVIPFMLLLFPAAAWWPRPGSPTEGRFATLAIAAALTVSASVGHGWRQLGNHLDSVAGAAAVIQPGSRVLPLIFAPGAEASPSMRGAGEFLDLHAWAIPTRLSRAMVPFGFENMRRLMVVARADADPPFPPGPDEFAGRILWNSHPQGVRVFADYGLSLSEITDDARFLVSEVTNPHFYDELQQTLLTQADLGFHYLLAIDPPPDFLASLGARPWPRLYARDGVYVYRLGLDEHVDVLPYGGGPTSR